MTKMLRLFFLGCLVSSLLAAAANVFASPRVPGFRVEVLVDGRAVPQYDAAGVRYVEALKGKEYAIRLHNPLGVRVAVALAVDGLNSIDARHTSAREARKWVLDPYETVIISGWQVNMHQARRFFFTTEEHSYAGRLGQPQNVGVISAVFFRERTVKVVPLTEAENRQRDTAPAAPARESKARKEAPAPSAAGESQQGSLSSQARADEYAATGIGERTDHQVHQVHMDLEPYPVAALNIRYEFRTQLVRLGILPEPDTDILGRRQRARGFEGGFCPDVK